MFRILWMSDLDIDMAYTVGKSTKCYDYSCCHATNEPESDDDKAGTYGSQKCNLPLAGFKKMIDTINLLNTTTYMSFTSFVYGGSSVAYVPEYTTAATVGQVHKEMIQYVRSKNPIQGIYYATGPHDLYPLNYESFSTINNPELTAMDAGINTATTKNTFSSLADDAT